VGASLVAQGVRQVKLYWSAAQRSLSLDGQPVRRLTEYLGALRTVVFCTEDLQLVKGAGRGRRRFLDLLLSQTHATYLPLLQRYARALRARNALLRQPGADPVALEGFSRELVAAGEVICRMRRELVPRFAPLARQAHARIANGAEELRLEYRSGVRQDFAVELAQSQARERSYRATLIGPHRDDLQLLLDDRPAAQYASEGQKRSLAIALKLAQAEYLAALHGAPPVLLIDDIMGELDEKRRGGFLPLLEQARQARGQVLMTVTAEAWPRELGAELQRWKVENGTLERVGGRAA
jgi:DNA replication and repair protein RecF